MKEQTVASIVPRHVHDDATDEADVEIFNLRLAGHVAPAEDSKAITSHNGMLRLSFTHAKNGRSLKENKRKSLSSTKDHRQEHRKKNKT
jgi:hypothetical protein